MNDQPQHGSPPSEADIITPSHPLHHLTLGKAPALVMEVPVHEDTYNPSEEELQDVFCPLRWVQMTVVYVIYLSSIQVYRARQLYSVVHYTIKDCVVTKLSRAMQRANGKLKVVLITPDINRYDDDFLRVRNNLPFSVLDRINMAHFTGALANARTDRQRKHKAVDLGVCGNNNCVRTVESLGLAKPNFFAGTLTPESLGLQRNFLEIILDQFPEDRGKVYSDQQRARHFLGPHMPDTISLPEGQRLAEQEYASVTPENDDRLVGAGLGLHCDRNNDHRDARYSPVFSLNLNAHLPSRGVFVKEACIFYGKGSANDYLGRWNKFSPHLYGLQHYYQEMPLNQKEITTDLIPAREEGPRRLGHCHVQYRKMFSTAPGLSWCMR